LEEKVDDESNNDGDYDDVISILMLADMDHERCKKCHGSVPGC